eukprot:5680710-Prymnesium_polylepis.2
MANSGPTCAILCRERALVEWRRHGLWRVERCESGRNLLIAQRLDIVRVPDARRSSGGERAGRCDIFSCEGVAHGIDGARQATVLAHGQRPLERRGSRG